MCKKLMMRIYCKLSSTLPVPITITLDILATWYRAEYSAMAISGVQLSISRKSSLTALGCWSENTVSPSMTLGYLINRDSLRLEYNHRSLLQPPHWEASLLRVEVLSYSSYIPSPWCRVWLIEGEPLKVC